MGSFIVLVIDDLDSNRRLLSDLVRPLGYEVLTAADGPTGLALLKERTVDLVILDIVMPGMDGYQVLEHIKQEKSLRHIPVIMISGIGEMESVVRCIKAGADDYLIKPFNPVLLRARIDSSLEKKQLHDQEENHRREIQEYNLKLEERVQSQVKEISDTQLATIFAMSKLADSRDPETGEHLERMREYARVLCLELQKVPRHAEYLTDAFIDNVYAAAPLHDIGKVGIPDRILQKPGKLTPEEFEVIKEHPVIGARTLRAVDELHPGNDFIRAGVDIAEFHHEKWDGSGYPHGLAGEDIPLVGRVLALADVYDALTSKRCYKDAFSHEKSKAIIVEERGRHFAPDVVDAFLAAESAFVRIRGTHKDTEKELLV